MSEPAVSFITPSFNGARLLPATIEAVLAQTIEDWEMVVLDDGSTDDTAAALAPFRDPRIRYVRQPENEGVVRARNRAVALARGRHIAALDHDDLCHPERLERQLAVLEANPDVVLVASAADHLEGGRTSPGHLPRPTSPGLLRWLLRIRNPLVWSSVMIRGDAARRLAPFQRVARHYAEDFDLYHRLARHGTIVRIDEPLVLYRIHAEGASNVHEARMVAVTGEVLAKAYAPALGDYAGEAGLLVALHLGAGRPAPDGATLKALAAILDRLHEQFIASEAPDQGCRQAIASEISRSWWQLVQRSLRAGLRPADAALTVRPQAIGDHEHDPGGFIASRVIGTGRAILHRARG